MQEKDGWKRVRPTVPDSHIIVRAARKAKKYHRHHKIYVRGAHYEYYFKKVDGQNSVIYRRRLKHHKMIDKKKKLIIPINSLIKGVIALVIILIIGICFYSGTIDIKNTVNNTKSIINDKYEEYKEEQTEKKRERIKMMEYEVVEIVNSIREEKGIRPLVWDDQLYQYSKKHSEEMASKRKLFHSSMYESYAENCWGGEGSTGWDANDIVNSWMSSPNHKTWLLCSNLHHVGVGIVITDTGMYASWTFWRRETSESDWRYT